MFHRNRWDHGGREHWRRFATRWWLTSLYVPLVLIGFTACQKPHSETTYSDALNKFRRGDSDSALALVDGALRETDNSNIALLWDFRILKSQILLRKQKPENARTLVANPPVSTLPKKIYAAARISEVQSSCYSNSTVDLKSIAAALEQETVGLDRALRAEAEFVIADCAFSADPRLAREHLRASAAFAHDVDGYLEARALGNLGYMLMEEGHYDPAIGQFSNALAVTDSPWLKESLFGDLGECYQQLGDWKVAESYSEKAEALASIVPDAGKDRVRWLIDLGREHFSQLEYAEASSFLSHAHQIAKQLSEKNLQARCLDNLAMVALANGDAASARAYVKEDEDLHPEGEQQLYLLLDKSRLAKLALDFRSAEGLLKEVLAAKSSSQIRYQAQTDLATLYVDTNQPVAAEEMFRAGSATADRALADLGNESSRISFQDYIPFYDEYVHFLIHQNRPLDALDVADHGRSRALAQTLKQSKPGVADPIQISAIQRKLKAKHQVVLAYWLGWKSESYLWAISSSQVKLFKLPAEKEVVDAVDAYNREVLEMTKAEESRLGEKLYDMLIAPAAAFIPRGSQVIIVPHRRLYKLNFETLVAPQPSPHFWVEDVCIQNASFVGVLTGSRKAQSRHAKDLLLIGAPLEASKDFPVLSHAPEELKKVAAHFRASQETVIEGKQAIPSAYSSSHPQQFRFFHFVTHGTASDANPLDSAIILSPSNQGFKLYAHEIVDTKASPELVTISTCYGAGTRQYSGEGLVGLAWAFMRAGAHQVVAALWEVDDAANADLMDQFYSELTRGKTAAVALRDSKLAMLHSTGPRKRPYYWASLQLYTGS